MKTCDECRGSGFVQWTCGEGTCDFEDYCKCAAGREAKLEMEEQRRKWRLRRMGEAGVFNCECADCKWARGE